MKNDSGALGNFGDDDDFGTVGEVDMFGLDEFGEAQGANAMWGAVIGGGIGTGAAIITRAMTKPTSKVHQFSELAGLLAGSAAGGVMIAMGPNMRNMGWSAIATAFVTNGLRQLEQSLFAPKLTLAEAQALVDAAAAKGGKAAPADVKPAAVAAKAAGWGGVVMDPTAVIQPYQGNGFGIHSIEPGYVVPANLPSMMNGFGGPGNVTMNPTGVIWPQGHPNAGFGAASIEPGYLIPGSGGGGFASGGGAGFGIDQPELMGPPTLVGAGDYGMSDNAGATQTRLLGGPSVSSMGAHFGATLFGGPN
jgi:hypothetical protein